MVLSAQRNAATYPKKVDANCCVPRIRRKFEVQVARLFPAESISYYGAQIKRAPVVYEADGQNTTAPQISKPWPCSVRHAYGEMHGQHAKSKECSDLQDRNLPELLLCWKEQRRHPEPSTSLDPSVWLGGLDAPGQTGPGCCEQASWTSSGLKTQSRFNLG